MAQYPPWTNYSPIDEINKTIAFYEGMKQYAKRRSHDDDDEDERPRRSRRKKNWTFGETFLWVSLAMPFVCTLQFYIFLLLLQNAANMMKAVTP